MSCGALWCVVVLFCGALYWGALCVVQRRQPTNLLVSVPDFPSLTQSFAPMAKALLLPVVVLKILGDLVDDNRKRIMNRARVAALASKDVFF